MAMSAENKRERDRERQKRFRDSLTQEQRKALYAKSSAIRSAKRASKARSEGRTPGKPGRKAMDLGIKKEAKKENQRRFRRNNLERRREYEAAHARRVRAEKAVKEGRTPGRIGREVIYTVEERQSRERANRQRQRQRDQEKHRSRSKKYYTLNKEQAACRVRKRRTLKYGNGGTHTASDIRGLMVLQKGKCAWCLTAFMDEKPHVDHYIPISKGGTNDRSNLRLLHAKCNWLKADNDPVAFGLRNGTLLW